jgi:hypothetical protein
LANAFVRPVYPRNDLDLIAGSIAALDDFWGRLTTMYGAVGIAAAPVCVDSAYGDRLGNLAAGRVPSVPALIDGVLDAVARAG